MKKPAFLDFHHRVAERTGVTTTLSKESALASAGSHKKKKNLLKNSQDTKSTKTSHTAEQTDDRVYYQKSRYSETGVPI